jgi:pyruvate dehydrogenase E1 component
VILAKTIKGWTLGAEVDGPQRHPPDQEDDRRAACELRDRLHLEDVIPDEHARGREPPFIRPAEGLPRTRLPAGATPRTRRIAPEAVVTVRPAIDLPDPRNRSTSCSPGPGTRRCPRPWRSPACCATSPATGDRRRIVPIVPDEARTFGMDSLFRELKIYARQGQKYEPVDHHLLLSYSRVTDGQILEEGITEAGRWLVDRRGDQLRHPRRADGPVLHLLFDVRVPARRRPDLGRGRRPGPGLPPRRHGRAHHAPGEGSSTRTATACCSRRPSPVCRAYDPAFAYELAIIEHDGIERMYAPRTRTSSITSPSTTRTTRCRHARPVGRRRGVA